MEKLCFLFGHSDTTEEILPLLRQEIELHYRQYGIRRFVVGQYGSFDRLAAFALGQVKQQLQDLSLQLLLAYHPAERQFALPPNFDGSFYPDGMERVPRRLAIVRANHAMLRQADSIICYVRASGNTRKLLDYARKHIPLISNLADQSPSPLPARTASKSSSIS